MIKIDDLKFDEKGLIPCIIQDHYTKEVLTLAYMNKESLKISMEKGLTCFWSRSKQQLWLKGETSGNYQHIVSIKADCDYDALVCDVIKDGFACHLNRESCFFDDVYLSEQYKEFSIDLLYKELEGRKIEKKEGSYTTYLFEQGIDKILKKVGEECTEVIIGAKNSKEEVQFEIADLCYHLLVLMIEMKLEPQDIIKELEKRHVVDKKVKQQKMK